MLVFVQEVEAHAGIFRLAKGLETAMATTRPLKAKQAAAKGQGKEANVEKEKAPEQKTRQGTAKSLKQAIAKFETKISNSADDIKMADYVRLLQLQKELADEKPKEVTVRWVDPWENK